MKKILFVLFVVLLNACALQTTHRGYVFPEDVEASITKIKTTKALQDFLGAPQVKTIYGNEVWIYYSADENNNGPFPMTYDNKTVILAWVKNNTVNKIKILKDADLEHVNIAEGETEIPAAIELNAMEELFNNIGRFSPGGLN